MEEYDVMAGLDGYQPEEIVDDFEILKGGFICKVNSGSMSEYDGNKEEFRGFRHVEYELEINGPVSVGRKFWGSYSLDSPYEDKKGKRAIHRMIDLFFTLGIDVSKITGAKSREDLAGAVNDALDAFVELELKVKAWAKQPYKKDPEGDGYVKDPDGEVKQAHVIKGLAVAGVAAGGAGEDIAY